MPTGGVPTAVWAVAGTTTHADFEYVDAVEKVLTNRSGSEQLLQVLVRRSNQAHVNTSRAAVPHATYLVFLQDPQQFDLNRRTHIADLVQE